MTPFHRSLPARALRGACLLLGLLAGSLALAQQYPARPIRVLVGVPPGGSTDAQARMFAEWLQDSLGQSAFVENRPGANTALAAEGVARAAPDGHSLLVATDAFLAMPLLTKVSFDPFKDFAPVGVLALNRFVLAVHPNVPVNNVQELVAWLKARPGKANYGSSGNAGASHLGLEKFKILTGTEFTHIPYKGAGPALTDAIAGRYEISMWTPTAIAGHVKAGKLKALAVTGPKRVAALPQVPTFAEAGLPAYDHTAWQAVFATAGTPRPVIDRLNGEIARMVASAKVKQKLDEAGVEAMAVKPEQMAEMLRNDSAELAKLIRTANIRMD